MQNLVTTLEQSKQLKEWGAPQDTCFGYYGDELYLSGDMENRRYYHLVAKSSAAYTFQELVEWLGDDFISLHKEVLPDSVDDGWSAEDFDNQCFGSNLLEAVFNLCEAIKGKE